MLRQPSWEVCVCWLHVKSQRIPVHFEKITPRRIREPDEIEEEHQYYEADVGKWHMERQISRRLTSNFLALVNTLLKARVPLLRPQLPNLEARFLYYL